MSCRTILRTLLYTSRSIESNYLLPRIVGMPQYDYSVHLCLMYTASFVAIRPLNVRSSLIIGLLIVVVLILISGGLLVKEY